MGTVNRRAELLRSLKFTLFSASAGLIQIGAFALCNDVIRLPAWLGYLIALVLSVLWNFTLNRRYTFRSAASVPRAMALVALFYLVFTPCTTWLEHWLTDVKLWNDYLVTALNMVLNLVSEFLYDRFVVFRGTIDFKKGAAGAVGNEKEDVLLLDDLRNRNGEDAVSILCREALARSVLQIYATRRAVRAKLLLEEVLTLVFGALLDVHADGQATLIELNVDVILGDTGQIRLDLVAIALVLNVNGERLGGNRVVCKVGHNIKQIEQRASRRTNAKNRTIRNHACHVYHSF